MPLSRRRFLTGGIALGTAVVAATPAAAWAATSGDWMAGLSGDRVLDDLTIPGTHDTCARVGGLFDVAKCQDLTLAGQLEAGIRFIDIRCRLYEGAFTIHHGPIYQELNFTDVLNRCRDFLTAHPGETVIMSIQQEYSEAAPAEWAAVFHERYLRDEGFAQLFYRESRVPRLGEVRGRIVLVSNQDFIGGIRATDTALTSYQNEWEAPVDRKWGLIREHLDACRSAQPGDARLFVNYTSTTGGEPLPDPRSYAAELNPRVAEYVAAAESGVLGVVVMDFAGTMAEGLVPGLIALNG